MSAPALSKPLTYKETDGVRHGRVGPYWWDANLVCWSFGTGSGDTVLGSGECRGYEDADAQVRAAIRKHLSDAGLAQGAGLDAGLAQGAGLDAVLGRLRGLVRARSLWRIRVDVLADTALMTVVDANGRTVLDWRAHIDSSLPHADAALSEAFPKEWP